MTSVALAQEVDWEMVKQEPNLGKQLFVQYKLHAGSHIYTGSSFSDYLQDGYVAHEFRLGWHSKGDHAWQHALNFPLYGVGVYSGNVGNPQALGTPSGVYGFMHFPFIRRKKHHFDIFFGFILIAA